MFDRKNFNRDEDKLQKRAEILYKDTKDNVTPKKSPKKLGESVYDDSTDTEGELSALKDMDTNKPKTKKTTSSNADTKTNKKEKDYEKTAELLYPTMRNQDGEKTQNNAKKIPDDNIESKDGELTGGAADIKNQNNNSAMKSKNVHKELDLNEEEFEIKDNKISPVKKKKEYEEINNVKFPNDTGNEKVEALKRTAKQDQSARFKEDNEYYLKHKAKLEQFGVDHVDNNIIKPALKQYSITDEAVENLHMSKTNSYMNTDYAKQNKVYNNYSEAPDNLKDYFKDKITEQIGADKLDKTKGIYIDANSESSNSLKKALLQDSKFIDKLKTYDKALKNNYSIDDSIRFKDENWYKALGHADIKDMHINDKGDIELYITDVYDFNEGEKNDLIRTGRNRQEKGEITPYFAVYRVIIPKEEKEQILKNYSKD